MAAVTWVTQAQPAALALRYARSTGRDAAARPLAWLPMSPCRPGHTVAAAGGSLVNVS